MKKVKQIDIANALGLSRVTITKALLNSSEISSGTRELVKAKAEEMGYFLNYIGRSLSSRRSFTIGLVVPKIAHSFFSLSIESFYEAATARGYNMIPTISFEDSRREAENIKILLSMGVDGIIVDPAGNVEDCAIYDKVTNAGVEFLFYDRYPVCYSHEAIVCNNFEAAKTGVSYIIAKGIQKIIHFTASQKINICKERLEGYKAALQAAGLKYESKNVIYAGLTEKEGYDHFISYYINHGCPRSVFAVNDSVALGIYNAAAVLKINIPDKLAILGFGDIDTAQMVTPSLTTIHIPIREMCFACVDKLISLIEKKDKKEYGEFPANLVIRDSI